MANSKEYNKAYHDKNKARRNKQIRDRQRLHKEIIQEHKLKNGCSICGYKKSARALQYHHTGDKEASIARLVTQGAALQRIFEEIDNCILVCANCHFEIHKEDQTMVNVS